MTQNLIGSEREWEDFYKEKKAIKKQNSGREKIVIGVASKFSKNVGSKATRNQ